MSIRRADILLIVFRQELAARSLRMPPASRVNPRFSAIQILNTTTVRYPGCRSGKKGMKLTESCHNRFWGNTWGFLDHLPLAMTKTVRRAISLVR